MLKKAGRSLLITIGLSIPVPALAETGLVAPLESADYRHVVRMPQAARELLRQDMLQHLTSLNEIIMHLSQGGLGKAAEVAEQRMGSGAMGQHRASKTPPGQFMPPEMRTIALGMHQAADRFAAVARKGNAEAALSALQDVTHQCVRCHWGFRTVEQAGK